jgi:hypothetical protein
MHIRTTAAALTALLLLASCRGNQDGAGSTADPAGQAVYHNPAANLRLTHPTSWTRLDYGQQGTKALVAFLSPPDDKGERQHLAFDVRKLAEPASLESLKDAAIAEAKTVFPNFDLVFSDRTTLGGRDAYRTLYNAGTERGSARIMQILALHEGRAYSATYTARSAAGFTRSLPQAEAIIGSIKIE